jgi:predicted esterase
MPKTRTISTALWAVFAVAACCASAALAAETPAFPPGQVVPRVVCENNIQQTYALYLPSGFVPSRKWPIVYAFDPGARGSLPVESFRPGAEQFGYIVVGSNNSQNGPLALSMAAVQAVWIDTHARFPIDDARVYAAGFSGGAHVAMRMALTLSGRVAGVIASGGALHDDVEPVPPGRFAFFGLAGMRDFNYAAMREVGQKLAGAGFPHRFRAFEGAHQWPPAEACAAALEWMGIQALKAGQPPRDEKFVKSLYDSRLKKAADEQAAERLCAAFREYQEIAEDFTGLTDVSAVASRIESLRASREYQQAAKEEAKREQKRDKQDLQNRQKAWGLVEYLINSAAKPSGGGREFDLSDSDDSSSSLTGPEGSDISALGEGNELGRRVAALNISGLRKKVRDSKDSDEGIVAERQIQRVTVSLVEISRGFLEQNKYRPAVTALEIAQDVAPESPWVLFSLARALALSGKKARALKTLTAAVEKGWARRESIESDGAFDSLRDEPAYKSLIEKMKSAAGSSG